MRILGVVEHVDEEAEHPGQLLLGCRRRCDSLGDAGLPAVQRLADDGSEEVLLALEVPVDRPLGQPAGLDDLAVAHARIAALGEEMERGAHQALPGRGGLGNRSQGHVR